MTLESHYSFSIRRSLKEAIHAVVRALFPDQAIVAEVEAVDLT